MRSFVVILLAFHLIGCGKIYELKIDAVPPTQPRLITNKSFSSSTYPVLMVLNPEMLDARKKEEKNSEVNLIRRGKAKFLSYIEKVLLQKQYQLISDDVLVKAKTKIGNTDTRFKFIEDEKSAEYTTTEYTPAEYAVYLGKETGADAILKVNAIGLKSNKAFFLRVDSEDELLPMSDKDELDEEIEELKRLNNEQGSDFCYIRSDRSQFVIDVEIIDVNSGSILAKGDAGFSTPNLIPRDYIAHYKSDCTKKDSNFSIKKYTFKGKIDDRVYKLIDLMFSTL